eukprot:gnl/Dysnectes_brevis/635_a702_1284.p1 GENE.gnl/Dysnectes_brevis/635_a702_1284~~gnl/Dysnectes_brevis/635_a702_1284.p1  ORF type:complete len:913 (+),score=77.17 gnl/Dysnectes_brevis/635_a702_1284:49-2787(+)
MADQEPVALSEPFQDFQIHQNQTISLLRNHDRVHFQPIQLDPQPPLLYHARAGWAFRIQTTRYGETQNEFIKISNILRSIKDHYPIEAQQWVTADRRYLDFSPSHPKGQPLTPAHLLPTNGQIPQYIADNTLAPLTRDTTLNPQDIIFLPVRADMVFRCEPQGGYDIPIIIWPCRLLAEGPLKLSDLSIILADVQNIPDSAARHLFDSTGRFARLPLPPNPLTQELINHVDNGIAVAHVRDRTGSGKSHSVLATCESCTVVAPRIADRRYIDNGGQFIQDIFKVFKGMIEKKALNLQSLDFLVHHQGLVDTIASSLITPIVECTTPCLILEVPVQSTRFKVLADRTLSSQTPVIYAFDEVFSEVLRLAQDTFKKIVSESERIARAFFVLVRAAVIKIKIALTDKRKVMGVFLDTVHELSLVLPGSSVVIGGASFLADQCDEQCVLCTVGSSLVPLARMSDAIIQSTNDYPVGLNEEAKKRLGLLFRGIPLLASSFVQAVNKTEGCLQSGFKETLTIALLRAGCTRRGLSPSSSSDTALRALLCLAGTVPGGLLQSEGNDSLISSGSGIVSIDGTAEFSLGGVLDHPPSFRIACPDGHPMLIIAGLLVLGRMTADHVRQALFRMMASIPSDRLLRSLKGKYTEIKTMYEFLHARASVLVDKLGDQTIDQTLDTIAPSMVTLLCQGDRPAFLECSLHDLMVQLHRLYGVTVHSRSRAPARTRIQDTFSSTPAAGQFEGGLCHDLRDIDMSFNHMVSFRDTLKRICHPIVQDCLVVPISDTAPDDAYVMSGTLDRSIPANRTAPKSRLRVRIAHKAGQRSYTEAPRTWRNEMKTGMTYPPLFDFCGDLQDILDIAVIRTYTGEGQAETTMTPATLNKTMDTGRRRFHLVIQYPLTAPPDDLSAESTLFHLTFSHQ